MLSVDCNLLDASSLGSPMVCAAAQVMVEDLKSTDAPLTRTGSYNYATCRPIASAQTPQRSQRYLECIKNGMRKP